MQKEFSDLFEMAEALLARMRVEHRKELFGRLRKVTDEAVKLLTTTRILKA
jgi:hypothetical protein